MPLSFLVPAFLAGLAALAVPLLLHLRHRERQRPMRFPSLMFLQRIAIQTAERRRITDWPLLLLRALAVALVVFAFARPVVRRAAAATEASGSRTVVIALDRSLSMAHTATWPAAIDSARRLIDGLGAEDRAALVLFDDDAVIAQGLTTDHAAVRAALGLARPGTRATRYASALRAARQVLDAASATTGEVHVVTDLQRSGVSGVAGMALRPGITVHPVAVTPPVANASLGHVTADRLAGDGRGTVAVAVQVTARGLGAPRSTAVTLAVNGRPSGSRTVVVAPDGVTPVRFDAIPLPPGDVRVEIAMTPDALAADDRLHAVIPAEVSHRILLVTPRGVGTDETLYLERALSIGDDPRFEIVRRSGVDPSVLREAGAVVFYDMPVPETAQVREWVSAGGGVIVAAGTRLGGSAAGSSLMPVTWNGRVERVTDRGGVIGDVSLEHPVFEPFRASASATLGEPRFLRYPRLAATAGADVLARFDDGNPALVEKRHGDGRVIVLGMPLDARNGDFPLQPAFLPFLRRVALHATGFVPTPLARVTGEGWRPAASVRNLVIRTPTDDLVRPDSQTAFGAVRLDAAGIYAAYRDQASGDPVAIVAANAPARESDLTPMPPSEILLGVGQDSTAVLGAGPTSSQETETRQRLWRVLLIAAALFLVAETIVASRGWRGTAGRFATASSAGGET